MKNTALLFFLTTLTALAQVKVGGTIGTNFSNINTNLYSSNSKAGLDLGGHARYLINDNIEILFDGIYRVSNFEVDGTEYSSVSDNTNPSKVDFKQISATYSVYFNYYLLDSKISFLIGPSFSFGSGLEPNDDSRSVSIGNNNISPDNLSSETQSNFFLTAGVTTGFENLKIIFKYSLGLKNLYSNTEFFNSDDFSSFTGEAKQNILSVALMYSFDLNI